MKKVLTLMTVLFFLSTPNVYSQICNGDFDCDHDVDGTDAVKFKADFFRKDCPDCPPCGDCQAYINENISDICEGYQCVPPAPVPKTGQTTCYNESGDPVLCTLIVYPQGQPYIGQDGGQQKGVEWPNPRFTIIYCDTNGPCSDQGSDCDADPDTDVVTDNLTGLMWTRDANMFGQRTWQQALDDCNSLDFAGYDDWRLPNRKELFSLVHDEYYAPALPNTAGTGQWSEGDPFTNQMWTFYWSSTSSVYSPTHAWYVEFYYGAVNTIIKSSGIHYVRAVRGGQ